MSFGINGRTLDVYIHSEDALDRVRALMKVDCDIEAEVLDTRTGRAFRTGSLAPVARGTSTIIGF